MFCNSGRMRKNFFSLLFILIYDFYRLQLKLLKESLLKWVRDNELERRRRRRSWVDSQPIYLLRTEYKCPARTEQLLRVSSVSKHTSLVLGTLKIFSSGRTCPVITVVLSGVWSSHCVVDYSQLQVDDNGT